MVLGGRRTGRAVVHCDREPAQKRLTCVCGERRAAVFLWPDLGRDDWVAEADVPLAEVSTRLRG